MKKISICETAGWLKKWDRYLILTHKRPDGDTIGSASALAKCLRSLGKTACLYANTEITEKYAGFAEGLIAGVGYEYDKIISVDVASVSQFPLGTEDLEDKVDLAIDHHMSNTGFAKYLCLEDRASCGEVIYEIISAMDVTLDGPMADCLYTAISTDTGCFAYGNTNYKTLEAAAAVAKAGADLPRLNKILFRTKSKSRASLDGYLYSNMDYYYEGNMAVAVVTLDMRKKLHIGEDDLDDIASLPIEIQGVRIGVTIKEQEDGAKISVRTGAGVDANKICSAFGGGGHKQAAGCFISGEVEEAKKKLVEEAGKVLS